VGLGVVDLGICGWRRSEEHGFTLVELLTVVAILEHRRLYYTLARGELQPNVCQFVS
jgi:Prokaryotic N-terminal methylation motif